MNRHWHPAASKEAILERARMLSRIRAFFDARGVIEVETPLLATAATTDLHLDSLQTLFHGNSHYLNTSPEYAMKRLLAAYGEAVYQVCRAFRDDELGPLHNPEFSMLEWYRPAFDMHQLMDELNELLCKLWQVDALPVLRYSYRQVFEEHAGFDPHIASAEICRDCALRYGIEQPVGLEDDKDGWLDWLLTQRVLPSMEQGRYFFIYDYPASQCVLSRLRNDEQGMKVASRFELFYGELELANGFHELQSAEEQRSRFLADNSARQAAGKPAMKIDEYLLAALDSGLPDCSGVAVGLDRLLMTLCDKSAIEDVLAFPWDRT